MFATAEGLLTQQDRLNSDGLQEVFTTNLFGHFLLVGGSDVHRDCITEHLREMACCRWITWHLFVYDNITAHILLYGATTTSYHATMFLKHSFKQFQLKFKRHFFFLHSPHFRLSNDLIDKIDFFFLYCQMLT